MKQIIALLVIATTMVSAQGFRPMAPGTLSGHAAVHSTSPHQTNIPDDWRFSRGGRPGVSLARPAATEAQVYFPDTVILHSSAATTRITAFYNHRGWTTSRLVEFLYTGFWVKYTLDTWTYLDDNGSSLDSMQTWEDGHWSNATLDSSTYDSRGNMLVHLYSYWSNGKWQDSILSSRTYDANGGMLTNWSKLRKNGAWTNSTQAAYTNNAQGKPLTYLSEQWNDNQWKNADQWTYAYDGTGNVSTLTRQYWQSAPAGWQNSTRVSYTHDGSGNELSLTVQAWSGGVWTNANRTTTTRDGHGNPVTALYESWSNDLWASFQRDTYTYDANDMALSHLTEKWQASAWVNWTRGAYAYDEHGNQLTGTNCAWSASSWIPADDQFSVFFVCDNSTYNFTGDSIRISYTLLNIAGITPPAGEMARGFSLSQNYPNPFNPVTQIEFQIPDSRFVKLKVYDLLGREVAVLVDEMKEPGTYSVTWNASGEASGVYFCRLDAGGIIQSRTMLLLK